MTIRVVLDTNVLVSALLVRGSNPDKIIQLVINKYIQVVISPEILTELHRTLKRKLNYSEREAKDVINWLRNIARIISPVHTVTQVCAKETDHRIIECALSGGVKIIISGDKKHLLSLKKYKEIEILSPANFLERVLK
ncbi:MAG: putative toxin-antitoxin system toxin component, PIN family [bacterium]